MRLRYIARLADDKDVLVLARRVNSTFLRQGKTELEKLDEDHRAVVLEEGDAVVSFIAFYRTEDEFYCTICWTSPRYRGRRCFARLVDWLKSYARWHGVTRLSFDVHHDNAGMVRIMERHCQKTFIRYNLEVECP
jgi:RimJ/RimL family protein N-acetyltransferase